MADHVSPSADCLNIWEPQLPETLRVCTCMHLYYYYYYFIVLTYLMNLHYYSYYCFFIIIIKSQWISWFSESADH
jgi:hypothetical protein